MTNRCRNRLPEVVAAVSEVEGPLLGIAPKPLTYLSWLASITLALNLGWELGQRRARADIAREILRRCINRPAGGRSTVFPGYPTDAERAVVQVSVGC